MKFNCAQQDLLSALNFIINAVAVKPQTQVLGGIYLKAEGDTLEIQATDYSLGMKGEILADAIEPGEIVVLGKKFFEVVRNMPADTLSINYDGSNSLLEVACAKIKFSINTLNTGDFPKIAVQNAMFSFKINVADLKELITKSIFACATEESQPIYTGCLFEIRDDRIDVVLRQEDNDIIISMRDMSKGFNPTIKEKQAELEFDNVEILNRIAYEIKYDRSIGMNSTMIKIAR